VYLAWNVRPRVCPSQRFQNDQRHSRYVSINAISQIIQPGSAANSGVVEAGHQVVFEPIPHLWCSSCHSQPSVGGTSPSATVFPFVGPNPETMVYSLNGAQNFLPSFITPDGPVREARFKFLLNPNGSLSNLSDGGVHDLFVISGRGDSGTCAIKQPNSRQNLESNNVIFRIPTPTFGAGLIENVSEETIYANMRANSEQKESLGISGHPNRDGNDGMIARFGWKAQNKSLEVFAGEAYNVEMGVTNELFQNERASPDEALNGGLPANCKLNRTPEDGTNINPAQYTAVPSDGFQSC